MKYNVKMLFLEATRRCNEKCNHCMRGDVQDIDLTKEDVDSMFEKLNGGSINTLVFTGGEPTLNPGIIIYTINKIIHERINVGHIQMVTNGKIFDANIASIFDKYNLYCFGKTMPGASDEIIDCFIGSYATIAFSKDKYHERINDEINDLYLKYAKHTDLEDHYAADVVVIKTGRASFGITYNYSILNMPYRVDTTNNSVDLFESLYLSANGLLTNNPTGEYGDMDKINFGHIKEISLGEVLEKNGIPLEDSINITDALKTKQLLQKKINQFD